MASLRDYQKVLIAGIVSAAHRHKRILVQSPTGSGKTVVLADLIRRAREKGRDVLFLVHRRELIYQAAKQLERVGVEAGIIMAGEEYHPAPAQLASVQTLYRRLDRIDMERFGLVIVDECFVGDTNVLTPMGNRRIDSVRCGDIVYNQTGAGAVQSVSARQATELYRLEFDDGSVTECTGNHPFFTEAGWRIASELKIGASFFSAEGMRILWEFVDAEGGAEREEMGRARVLLDILREEAEKPDEQSSGKAENESSAAGDQAHAYQKRRQRAITALGSASTSACVRGGLGVGVSDSNRGCERMRLSDVLQAGLSESRESDRNRGRWTLSFKPAEEGSGQEENGVSCFPRLVNISRVERAVPEPVFNLHVSGHPSYFANGKLVHNCHHHGAKTYVEILNRVNGAHVIGFTATPRRLGGSPLGDVFDTLCLGPKIPDLQALGFLCGTEYMSATMPDLRGIETTGGDYSHKGLHEKAVPQLIGGVVDHYLSYGGKKGIIFTCGQKHSFYLRDEFERHGRRALVIDSRTPPEEREELESEFKRSETGILVNCGIYAEGYDVPDCDTLAVARPTKSLVLYLQMLGRGLRPGKDKTLLVIDHGANVYRHGFAEDGRDWSLEKSADKNKAQEEQSERIKKYAACKVCGSMVTGPVCHTCGHEITRLERAKNVRELKNCGLKLIDRKDQRKRKSLPIATAAGWQAIVNYCALKGWTMGCAAHRFKARFGAWPRAVLDTRPLPIGGEWRMSAKEWLYLHQ